MKECIPKPIDGYKDINPKELTLKKLTPDEQRCLHEFKEHQKGGFIFLASVCAMIGILIPAVTIYNLVIDNMVPMDDLIASIIFGLLFGIAIPIFVIRIRKGYDRPIIGAKVGYLNGIWSMHKGGNSKRHYYFDVKFTDDNTRMKCVICSRRDVYYSVNPNDKILVITYAGQKAYGIKLN